MTLTPMRYKDFIWPHNPRVYTIDFNRRVAASKIPFGLYHLQDLDRAQRVMEGEGEFVGPDAYAQFGRLASVFYQGGAGPLVHPLWQTASAHFVSLRLEQEPRPDYVRYSFTFWEDSDWYKAVPQRVPTGKTDSQTSTPASAATAPLYHRVVRGDTLWGISNQYGVTLSELIARNPQIKNPNLIHVGDEVRVK